MNMVNELLGIQYNIAKANRTDKKVQNLASYINEDTLRAIHKTMDKKKAYGIDKVTKEDTFGVAAGRARLALGMLALYAAAMACMLAVSQLDAGVLKTMLSSFFLLLRKVFPCGLLAAVVVSTTHVNEFMSALSRMRVPRQVTIPLAVMLRYVPAIREDWRFIKDAMRMRGVSPSLAGFLRRPGMTVECLYVPLMMGASNVADELSMASVARGIENPAPRTCFTHIEFRVADGVLVAAGALVLAAAIACGALGAGR